MKNEELAAEDLVFLDHLAELTMAGDEAFPDIRSIFENEPGLHLPAEFEL